MVWQYFVHSNKRSLQSLRPTRGLTVKLLEALSTCPRLEHLDVSCDALDADSCEPDFLLITRASLPKLRSLTIGSDKGDAHVTRILNEGVIGTAPFLVSA